MAQYELAFILPADLTAARQKNLLAKLAKFIGEVGGKITKENPWGKRTLAYPIKKKNEGLYFLWEVELPENKAAEIKRIFEVEEEVLRHLLVRSRRR
jgi:small subunit ribosomal protein S6